MLATLFVLISLLHGSSTAINNLDYFAYELPGILHQQRKFFENGSLLQELAETRERFNLFSVVEAILDGEEAERSRFFSSFEGSSATKYKTSLGLVSRQCATNLLHLFRGAFSKELWAMKMLDAWGKPPSGLLDLRLNSFGEFDQCRRIMVPSSHSDKQKVEGQFCMASFELFGDITDSMEFSVSEGICVPSSCSDKDVNYLASLLVKLSGLGKTFKQTQVKCYAEEPLDTPAICVIILVSVIVAIVLFATALDYKLLSLESESRSQSEAGVVGVLDTRTAQINVTAGDEYQPLLPPQGRRSSQHWLQNTFKRDESLSKVLLLCSLRVNCAKLFMSGAENPDSMSCLNGIRCLSMVWIIAGHLVLMQVHSAVNVPDYLTSHLRYWRYQLLVHTSLACDTFFTISGVLVGYNLFVGLKKFNGKMVWHWFYICRYLRLTPTMILILFIYGFTFKYWGQGPIWVKHSINNDVCSEAIWHNLLYIQNFYSHGCMTWTWYLSVDTQFYVISPIFICALYWRPKIGYLITGLVSTASALWTFYIAYVNNLPPTILARLENSEVTGSMWTDYYAASWCRITPYLIGILSGYLLYRTEKKINMHWALNALGWFTSAAIFFTVLLATANSIVIFPDTHAYSSLESATYLVFYRNAWSLVIAWVIISCVTGNAPPVDRLLSIDAFMPLGRSTYCAYLIHEALLSWLILQQPVAYVLNDATIVMYWFGLCTLTFLGAFILTLFFESPILGMQRLMLTSFANKKEPRNTMN